MSNTISAPVTIAQTVITAPITIGSKGEKGDTGAAGADGADGAATFDELTDKATADLPAINTPLASALSAKANSADLGTAAYVSANQDLRTVADVKFGGIAVNSPINLNNLSVSGSKAVLRAGSTSVEGLQSGLCFASTSAAPFFNMAGFGASSTIFGGGVDGHAYRSVRILAGGQMLFGDGTSTLDVGLKRADSSSLEINSGATGDYRDIKVRSVMVTGTNSCGTYTIGTLPVSPTANAFCTVTDADSPTVGAAVSSGGSTKCIVWHDGTEWIVFAISPN